MNILKAINWKIIFTVFVIGLFVLYFFSNQEKLLELLKINLIYLIPIILIQYLTLFINGLFIQRILRAFDKYMGTAESFYVSLLTSIGNYFGPLLGGAGIRAVYLKKKYKLKYSHFMSTLYGNFIIIILINSIFGLLALWALPISLDDFNSLSLLLVLIGMAAVTIMFIVVGVPKSIINYLNNRKNLKKFAEIASQMSEGWNRIVENKRLLLELFSLTSINFLFSVLLINVELSAIGISLGFWNMVFYSVLGTISLLISITPGALGIKEGILIFAKAIVGLSTPQIVALAVIDRGVRYFVLGFGWLVMVIFKKTKDFTPGEEPKAQSDLDQ